jgi:hypothetical protein
MAVKEAPLVWRTFSEDYVTLTEERAVASFGDKDGEELNAVAHVTSGLELTSGRHYWEVELLNTANVATYFVGVSAPNLETSCRWSGENTWSINTAIGATYVHSTLCNGVNDTGYGASNDPYISGDRVGALLDLDKGSLLFFKNGVQNGPGILAGNIKGPVVHVVQMQDVGQSVRLHPSAFPEGHSP